MPADALTRIRARGHIGIRLGLDRMRALLGRLGDPQRSLRGVLVGGTNGKGSVAAMVASMLGAAGYSTGQSPSPHLHSYRERVTIDGQPVAADVLEALLEEVLAASEPGTVEHGPATEFELLTAAAYLHAARHPVDVMVMEVGLGGRLDASNTWDADVAAITNVGLDHAEYLGDDVASVAREKAAIMRARRPIVTGADGVGLEVIRAAAADLEAPLLHCPPLPVASLDTTGIVVEHERLGRLSVPLLGRHQAANTAVAIGIIDSLDRVAVASVGSHAVRAGLGAASWPGRLELVRRDGLTIVLDGAHNPDGARVLATTIDELAPSLPTGRATLLVGVMADKEIGGMLAALAASRTLGEAQVVAAGVPDTMRSLPAAELARAWEAASGRPAAAVSDDADAALQQALALATATGGPLLVAGSLYLVGHLRTRLVPGASGMGDA